MSFTKVARAVGAAVALAAGVAVLTAGTASANPGDIPGGDNSHGRNGDIEPGGVPVHGSVQALTGATKALPSGGGGGGGEQGSGY